MGAFHVKRKGFVQVCSAPHLKAGRPRHPSCSRLHHALNRYGWFHVKRVAVIPFHWIGCARPTTFRALLTAR